MRFPNADRVGGPQILDGALERGSAGHAGFVGRADAAPVGVIAPLVDGHRLGGRRDVV